MLKSSYVKSRCIIIWISLALILYMNQKPCEVSWNFIGFTVNRWDWKIQRIQNMSCQCMCNSAINFTPACFKFTRGMKHVNFNISKMKMSLKSSMYELNEIPFRMHKYQVSFWQAKDVTFALKYSIQCLTSVLLKY